MAIETEGWIEVSKWDESELTDQYAWQALLNIGTYVDLIDEVTEILFGYSKRIIRDQYSIEAIAKDRGIPNNPSTEVKAAIERTQLFEKEYGEGETFGHTHIYLSEIKIVDWQKLELINQDSDWMRLFSLVEKLLEDNRFEANKIRFVVWFVW